MEVQVLSSRSHPMGLREFDAACEAAGYTWLVGVDEAGRGPLAGPVVAAACHIPSDVIFEGINDSKKLTPKRRAVLYDQLIQHPRVVYGIGIASAEEIDQLNIYQATLHAMREAIAALSQPPGYLMVDGPVMPTTLYPGVPLIGGDARSYLIAAASILAKEYRDRHMQDLDKQWPMYGFAKHKGYGTAAHLQALERYGPAPCHRRSFAPLKWLVN
jgi:ribonuclease HII